MASCLASIFTPTAHLPLVILPIMHQPTTTSPSHVRKPWLHFIQQERHWLTWGFLLTFFSSFGQTFLLSLYIPSLRTTFGLDEGNIGLLYATATLSSALCLAWVGRLIDWLQLRHFVALALTTYCLALTTLATAQSVLWAGLGLLGLRLAGQGLMGHIAITTMARRYDAERGRSVSLVTLGFSAGEMVFPVLTASAIAALGWRFALGTSAIIVGPCLGLLLFILMRNREGWQRSPNPSDPPAPQNTAPKSSRAHLLQFINTRAFTIIAPTIFLLGFFNTAIFLFQLTLGSERGWSAKWVAASLSAYAISSAIALLIGGILVDQCTAKKLFPFYLIPFLGGLLLLAFAQHPWFYPLALTLLGVSNGLGSPIKTSVIAEIFGTQWLGTVRSLFTVIMIVSTALGPLVFGYLLDRQWSFQNIFLASACIVTLILFNSLRILQLNPTHTQQ